EAALRFSQLRLCFHDQHLPQSEDGSAKIRGARSRARRQRQEMDLRRVLPKREREGEPLVLAAHLHELLHARGMAVAVPGMGLYRRLRVHLFRMTGDSIAVSRIP